MSGGATISSRREQAYAVMLTATAAVLVQGPLMGHVVALGGELLNMRYSAGYLRDAVKGYLLAGG